jgi:hypothetical protein
LNLTRIAKLGLIFSTATGLAAPALAQTSVADGFEGWCIPAETQPVQDGRTGQIFDVTFGLSVTLDGYELSYEEGGYCTFSNPTNASGLDERAFDAVCDGGDMDVVATGRDSFRAMIATVEDPNTLEVQGVLIEAGRVVELSPCLDLGWSNIHLELGYELGYRQPNLNTPDVRYLAELIHWRWGTGGTFVDGRLQEAIGLEPNFADRYIIGTLGGCGTDCQSPFIFDTRDGSNIELTLSDDPYAEYANFSFSMVDDRGSLIVSWRDGDCVRQEFALQGNSLSMVRETRTPADQFEFTGYPIHCPKGEDVSQDVDDLTSDVLAALGVGSSSELAPVTSLSPRARPSSEISFPGSRTAPLQASPSVPLGQTTLSREQKGDLNFAGICIGHAEEGNALLRARGASTNFNQIIIAARRSIDPLLRQVSDADAYSEFTSWRDATREQLAGNSVQVRTAMVAAFLIECNNKYGL